ncbi:ATP-binding cassette domain-containing protein [uncultured Methylobacterium sp.]|jgi:ABC-type bacteriocin/lantibiotic exporter with double-glycine peptidase domain|uniref:peptidase domain-containing ABC transporter n=1 Tax=uncultured Methylobacterium sp. TaxID=157278 RepID=UPI00262780D6|nr:ATP-binding cassette domain-containing protein [uncultured Methylobacterium sp.]
MASSVPGRSSSTFGWRWIAGCLRLRRGQVLGLAGLIAAGYGAGLVFPVATQRIVDAIVAGHVDASLTGLALLAVAAIALDVGIPYVRQRLIIALGAFLDRRIARRLFAHLMRVGVDGTPVRSGEILTHFQQAEKIREFVLHHLPHTIIDTGGGLVALGLVFAYDPVVGAALVLAAPAVVVLARGQLGPMRRSAERWYAATGARQSMLAETVNGLSTVKSLAIEGARVRRWEALTHGLVGEMRGLLDQSRRYALRTQLASRLLTLLVVGLGCWRMYRGHITVGELLALQILAARITGPLLAASEIARAVQEVRVAVGHLSTFLALPRERAERHPPLRRLGPGGVALHGVSLTYPGAARPALAGLSAVLPERGLVGIVGRNGSGKSTLLRILLGLRRDYHGRIEIGGADLRHYDPRWLRGRIGTVDQDTILFSGSVRDAVAGPRHDEAALREALRFAGALDLVEGLPDGLDTDLAENGRSLSGGQRQRLAVARAVIRDPAIAILDEPTAFLDPEAALALERRLTAWGRERLLILVTHHLAAVREAACILVLDDGRLAGAGRHEDLLRTVPVYASLWEDYARSLAPEASREPA